MPSQQQWIQTFWQFKERIFTEKTLTEHTYRNASNKRLGRLLNFCEFKGGVYSRGRGGGV